MIRGHDQPSACSSAYFCVSFGWTLGGGGSESDQARRAVSGQPKAERSVDYVSSGEFLSPGPSLKVIRVVMV